MILFLLSESYNYVISYLKSNKWIAEVSTRKECSSCVCFPAKFLPICNYKNLCKQVTVFKEKYFSHTSYTSWPFCYFSEEVIYKLFCVISASRIRATDWPGIDDLKRFFFSWSVVKTHLWISILNIVIKTFLRSSLIPTANVLRREECYEFSSKV